MGEEKSPIWDNPLFSAIKKHMNSPQERDAQILALVQEFIDVANRLKDEGKPMEIINASLMLASGTYATYLAAGNNGYLKEGGIRKVSEALQDKPGESAGDQEGPTQS